MHYILVPLFYAGIAFAGRAFTARGVSDWYPSLLKPPFTPPGPIIGAIWTVIYIFTALAFIIYINRARGSAWLRRVAWLFVLNGILNALWSYIFFTKHMLGLAVADAASIFISVGAIMVLAWPKAKATSFLLLPYLMWTGFATYLAYEIYRLN